MKALKKQKIAVLMGGFSAEREVSLNSGHAVLKALQDQGYQAYPFDPKETPIEQLKEQGVERVFNILHGGIGENGVIQGTLDMLGIPYTGCGVMSSALTMDKLRTKMLWQAFGLPIAAMEVVHRQDVEQIDVEAIIQRLGLPLMVKPSLEGSSVGMTKVERAEELKSAVLFALKFDQTALIEEWLAGEEYSIPVLDGQVLPAIHIMPEGDFYDYQAKYISDNTRYVCPADLTLERTEELKRLVKKAYDVMDCRGWARVDAMCDAKGDFKLLEVNTAPGMTSHSLFPMSAKVVGYSFEQLVEKILELSC